MYGEKGAASLERRAASAALVAFALMLFARLPLSSLLEPFEGDRSAPVGGGGVSGQET